MGSGKRALVVGSRAALLAMGLTACAPGDRATAEREIARAANLTLVPTVDGIDTPVLGAAPGPSLPAAAWNGQRFLLAWNDVRTTSDRIAAARIEPDGALVDRVNLLAPQPSGSEWQGSVACSDAACLVAFKAIPFSTVVIQAVRFDRNGNVLDAAPLAVSPTGSSYDAQPPSVAFDGTAFVVAWAQQATSTSSYVNGVRVTAAGVVVDTTPKRLVTSTTSTSLRDAHVVHDGTDLVLAWTEGTARVLASRVASDLSLRDAPPISVGGTPAGAVGSPALASDGSGFLVAWTENDAAQGGPAIKAQRFAADATATSAVVTVEPAKTGTVYAIASAFDGTGFWLTWARTATDSDVFLARLDAAGAPVGAVQPFAAGAGSQYSPALAATPGRTLVAWVDVGGLYEKVLTPGGTALGPATRTSLSLNKQTKPALVWNGTGFSALWLDTRDAPQQVYGMVLDEDAAPLRATAFPISQGPDYAWNAVLGTDGTSALAVWSAGTTTPTATRARRYDATGAPVGAEIAVGTAAFSPKSIAFGGGVYLVVGDTFSPSTQSLALRIDASGHVLDSAPFLLATGQSNPMVASDGTRFLIVFRPSTTAVPAVRVGTDGQLLDASPLDLFPAGAEPLSAASVAFGGGVYLVVWNDLALNEVGGVRVNPDGSRVDETVLKLTAQTALDVETNPVVAFNGTAFVVAWRNSLYDSSSQVKAEAHKYTTVTPGGVPGSIGTLAPLATRDSLLDPIAIASGNGRTLAGYRTLDTTTPYAIDRVKLKYVAPAAVPVGGRSCCQSTCAGGGADCQACSLIAGAAQNGTCAAIAEATACGAAGMCAAGVCVGPPDAGSDGGREDTTSGDSGAGDAAGDRPADVKPPDAAGGDVGAGADASGDGAGGKDAAPSSDGAGGKDGGAVDTGGGGGGGTDAAPGTGGGAGGAGGNGGRDSGVTGGAGRDAATGGSSGSGGCGCATTPPASGGLELAGCVVACLAALGRRRNRSRSEPACCQARNGKISPVFCHIAGG